MRNALVRKNIAALLCTVALLAAGCSTVQQKAPGEEVPVVQVWKATASESGSIASGKVIAADEIQVVSKLPGRVSQVHVKEGSVVKQGDVLVELDATEYLQQVKQAEAAVAIAQARLADAKAGARSEELKRLESGVEQAKATLTVAEQTYDRMKVMFDSGAISQAELERVSLEREKARTAFEQAQAQYDLAKAGPTDNSVLALEAEVDRLKTSLAMAKTTYENSFIRAPISGIIARLSIDPGEMAQPGVPLLVLVNMSEVKIETSVPQEKINRISTGSQVSVHVEGLGGKLVNGTVEFVSPVSDPNSSSFPVKIRVKNPDGSLRAGMLAEVFLENQQQHGWKLPASSVIDIDNKHYIYKVDQDVLHRVEVNVIEMNQQWVAVASGVAEGDQIVLQPDGKLAEGSKVRVQ